MNELDYTDMIIDQILSIIENPSKLIMKKAEKHTCDFVVELVNKYFENLNPLYLENNILPSIKKELINTLQNDFQASAWMLIQVFVMKQGISGFNEDIKKKDCKNIDGVEFSAFEMKEMVAIGYIFKTDIYYANLLKEKTRTVTYYERIED